MLEEGIAELATWSTQKSHSQPSAPSADDEVTVLQKANDLLKTELLAAQTAQKRSMAQLLELNHERAERVQQDEAKAKRKKERRLLGMKEAERKRKVVMRLAGKGSEDEDGDEEMGDGGAEDDEDELRSSTDEMTPSD